MNKIDSSQINLDSLKDGLNLNVVSEDSNGLVPQLPTENPSTSYLRGDGTWANLQGTRTITYVTLSPTSWTGSAKPYSQTATVQDLTSDSTVYVEPDYSQSNIVNMLDEAGKCMIVATDQSTTTLTFKALKDKPSIAITYKVTVENSGMKLASNNIDVQFAPSSQVGEISPGSEGQLIFFYD